MKNIVNEEGLCFILSFMVCENSRIGVSHCIITGGFRYHVIFSECSVTMFYGRAQQNLVVFCHRLFSWNVPANKA